MRAVALSAPFFAAIGSTVVTIPVAITSAVVFGVMALWTGVNEYRAAFTKNAARESTFSDQQIRRGLIGYAKELLSSPGFALAVQSCCYFYTSLVALLKGEPFMSAVFVLFAIGEAAAARIGNQGYLVAPREALTIESAIVKAWSCLPARLKIILSDPGACFCAGNVALILYQINLPKLLSNTWATVFSGGGLCLAASGVLLGLSPLLKRRTPQASGTASILGGIGDLALGASSILYGSAYTGWATILWGVSNILLGVKVGNTVFIRAFSHARKDGGERIR